MEEKIRQKLLVALNPEILEVTNNSKLHRGHIGDNGSNETHFKIEISSTKLKNLNKISAHREINNILQEEFQNGLHALEIKII